jgi:hypothetical protein
MTNSPRWPYRVAAVVAVVCGGFLLLGGFGHLTAILDSRAGQAFDYRFVSLLTTSGLLMFPGLVGIGSCYWLWKGATWAFVSCLLSALALMLYLLLLVYMKMRTPEVMVGSELYFMMAFVAAHLLASANGLFWLQYSRRN